MDHHRGTVPIGDVILVFLLFIYLHKFLFFLSALLTGDWPCPVEGETTPAVWTPDQLPPVREEQTQHFGTK